MDNLRPLAYLSLVGASKSRRSQITIEFVATIALGVIFLVAVMIYIDSQYSDYSKEQMDQAVRDMTIALKIELDTAYSVSDGYERQVSLPPKLEGSDYSVIIENRVITVSSGSFSYSKMVPPLSGNFSKGVNKITKAEGIMVIS